MQHADAENGHDKWWTIINHTIDKFVVAAY